MNLTKRMQLGIVLLGLWPWTAALADEAVSTTEQRDGPRVEEGAKEMRADPASAGYNELSPMVVRGRKRHESPRAATMRPWIVSGWTPDRMDRGLMRESPRLTSLRVWRWPGVTPDRMFRGIPSRSPRADVNFPARREER